MSAEVLDLPEQFAGQPSSRQGAGSVQEEMKEDVISVSAGRDVAETEGVVTLIHRDPEDIRLLLRLSSAGIMLALLLVASVAMNIYLYRQGPMLVFKNPEDGRVLQVNNTVFGSSDPIKYGADRLTDEDKLYAARQYTKYLYALDPATRAGDIEKALRMMVPQSAVALFQRMKEGNQLERQAQEKWQGVWTPQVIRVNGSDPYKVDCIGTQEITRVVGSKAVTDSRQLAFTLKLVADPLRRADRNERTGFVIADILDFKEIANPTTTSSSSAPAGANANSALVASPEAADETAVGAATKTRSASESK